jgi:hypothetical protein
MRTLLQRNLQPLPPLPQMCPGSLISSPARCCPTVDNLSWCGGLLAVIHLARSQHVLALLSGSVGVHWTGMAHMHLAVCSNNQVH